MILNLNPKTFRIFLYIILHKLFLVSHFILLLVCSASKICCCKFVVDYFFGYHTQGNIQPWYISSATSVQIIFFSHSNNCSSGLLYSDTTNIRRQPSNSQ